MILLDQAKAYFLAIHSRSDVLPFFAPDVTQREFPNRLVPAGATRDLAALAQARDRGRQALISERYEIVNAIEQEERLALEVIWTATLAVPLGSIPRGGTMRAHFGVFFTFKDGLIRSQHNYDCFDAF